MHSNNLGKRFCLAHLYHTAIDAERLFTMQQVVDSDLENRLLERILKPR